MKNIHVLPTDKPSRVLYNSTLKSFCIQKEIDGMFINDGKVSGADFWGLEKALNNSFKPHNIYITSNEEIKEGDWILNETHNIEKAISHYNYKSLSSDCKKIILTTDVDLIKDGVQDIDDEFLEWFVNNPSCEEVEIKLVEQRSHLSLNDWVDKDENGKFPISIAGAFCYRKIYKIIIPKEEPKVSIKKKYIDDQDAYGYDILVKEKPKQETLEEAAVKWIRQPKLITEKESFIAGAKWQQERSYSEEDMKKMYKAGYQRGLRGLPIQDIIEVPSKGWFEQFKNK